MNSAIQRLASLLLVLFAGIAFGGDFDYMLRPPLPVPGAKTYSPVAGGFNGAPVYSYDMSDTPVHRTESTSVGMIASEAANSTVVGAFVQPPSGFAVDWSKTVEAFRSSEAVTNGYAFYTELSDPSERFVASRCGSFEITWFGVGGETKVVEYQVIAPSTVVPHRLYWTSEGFNCPAVSVPKNYGVRLFGNQALFWREDSTNANGMAVYDYGVHYNKENSIISAYASMVNGEASGPEGYFVVAYYDSGLCERLLGYTVVEVARPDEIYLRVTVGSEVRPQNENYDPDSGLYLPVIQHLQSTTSGSDPREPYFYQQKPLAGVYHKKENRIYAISETMTDARDPKVAEIGAKKAEICWEAADDFKVFWPFELTCYHITWPDCPTVVVGSEATERGPGVTVPADYSVSLLDWRVPNAGVAAVPTDENKVTVNGAGRFCLKLENTAKDDFWFIPLKSALNTDTDAFPAQTAQPWPIGYEVLPQVLRASEDGGRSAELVKTVDADAAGYIYEKESSGWNWNPNLYHAAGASAKATVEDEAFSSLASSIHFVGVTSEKTDIEVWWQRSYRTGDMPSAVEFPVLPQRYKAVWPGADSVQDIVIASTRGSATGGRRSSGRSLYLMSPSSYGTLNYEFTPSGAEAATIGFWFNARPTSGEAYEVEPVTGRVVSVSFGTESLDLRVVDNRNATQVALCELSYGGVVVTQFQAQVNVWMPVYLRLSDGRASVSFGGAFVDVGAHGKFASPAAGSCTVVIGDESGGAAAGTALDGLSVWNFALADDFPQASVTNAMSAVRSRATVKLDSSTASTTGNGVVYVQDENTCRFFTGTGLALVSPGCPRWDDGVFAVSDGVTPRVYYRNEKGVCGYNPNEEHAFALQNADGDYVLYALRNDMNDTSSKPYVFMEYAENGRGAMRVFRVLDANDYYPWPNLIATAGSKIVTIPPLDRMPSGLCTNSYARKNAADTGAGPVTYRDRTGALWARRDGILDHYIYYYGEKGFICTADKDAALDGKVLPFLNRDNAYDWTADAARGHARKAYTQEMLMKLTPTPVKQTSSWPNDAPMMSIAQVLTTAEYGLPEIYNWKTAAITYPTCTKSATDKDKRVVKLIDPTVARTADFDLTSDFPGEYGFTLGSTGDCFLRQGKYYFVGLPPVVSDRLYVDINAAGTGKARLTFVGDLHKETTGTTYLRVNSLSTNEYNAINNFFAKKGTADRTGSRTDGVQKLQDALKTIYNAGDKEPSPQIEENDTSLVINYGEKDHYALVATGQGNGYVTIIENDGPEAEGLPINMKVINVGTNLYCGQIIALTDPNNTLSEQLNILYTAPLGRSADDFTFEWFRTDAPADGHTPTVPAMASADPTATYKGGDGAWPRGCDTSRSGDGKSCIEAVNPAAATLNELVNRYWTLHYRAKDNTPAHKITEGRWSVWCEPTLAEGWVQRVLNAITPFAQRTADFYNNAADTHTTIPSQIGPPWRGDVALNNENVQSVGLMQLYRTILNKAESMSIARTAEIADSVSAAANKQLILAASRLVDFNLLLGSEAYSDAKNPVVGSADGTTFTGSVFSFANQVDSLLDEELALLRGRTSATSPTTWTYPCYNRLLWNYTKGMTQGELAYVNNYNIIASEGQDTAATAAVQYPQGHGDAYGYYLSAVTEFYRLLRNPAFTWGQASMMEMLVAQKVVNVDYEEEDKFAEAAYRLAKTGVDVVDLTARKQWSDNAGNLRSGYFGDRSVLNKAEIPQAMGYGETACRAGFGALCNWAVANTLLPASATNAVRYFTDQSIACVTRQNCASLDPLASTVATLETKVNNVDAGLNPLGLSENAIPFDIAPSMYAGTPASGPITHYAQIRARAVKALENCETALAYAQKYGSQIAAIQELEGNLSVETEDQEREYKKQLIAVFGRPIADDIGAGKLYEQGYDGPDLYHYAYMDVSEYGLETLTNDTAEMGIYTYAYVRKDGSWSDVAPADMSGVTVVSNTLGTVRLNLTADGLVAKPKEYTGTRACEGSIQAAYREFLTAYVKAKNATDAYAAAKARFNWQRHVAETTLTKNAAYYKYVDKDYVEMYKAYDSLLDSERASVLLGAIADETYGVFKYTTTTVGAIGMVSTMIVDTKKAINGCICMVVEELARAGKTAADIAAVNYQNILNHNSVDAQREALELAYYNAKSDVVSSIVDACQAMTAAAADCQAAHAELLSAQQGFRTRLEEGEQILKARKLMRERAASTAVTARYRDMFARVERNNALSKYSTTFDIAQRYVFELAKVYDYETGLLTSDSAAGGAFLGAVVGTRALGAKNLTSDSSVTDDGLWGVVARLDANWSVLESRLGANNPLYEQKWHSLRYSNFRIDPAGTSDVAWREELAKYWVDDIFGDARVARHCQPPAGASGKMAGLVIPFATSIAAGENFFGKTLMGGEEQYAASAYATRIMAAGVKLVGYDTLVTSGVEGLAVNPQVYLVPTGRDYMRTPAGTTRDIVSFSVVDQVLPLPYAIGSTELDDMDWVATLSGLDGSADSMAMIRRHAQFPANGNLETSQRLIGRSAWNDGWLLVIPANAMNGNAATAKKRVLSGAVTDIQIGFKTDTRQGN